MTPTEHFSICEKVKHEIRVKSFTEMPIDHELVKRIWSIFRCMCDHRNVNYLLFFVESLYYFFDDLVIIPRKDTPDVMNTQIQELFDSVKKFMGVMQRNQIIERRESGSVRGGSFYSHERIDENIFETI